MSHPWALSRVLSSLSLLEQSPSLWVSSPGRLLALVFFWVSGQFVPVLFYGYAVHPLLPGNTNDASLKSLVLEGTSDQRVIFKLKKNQM